MTKSDRGGPDGPHDDLGDLVGEDGDARLLAALDAMSDALTDPPDDLTAHRHLAAIRAQVARRADAAVVADTRAEAAVVRGGGGRRPMWTRVVGQAATITVALMVASVALATFGALPAAAQRTAVDLAERVGVTLPTPERIGPDGTVIPPDLGKDLPAPTPAVDPADPAPAVADGAVATHTGPGLGKPEGGPPWHDEDGGPGRSYEAPGHTGNAPGRDDDGGDGPGNSGNAPGQTGDAPGLDDTTTTDADDGPGNSADAPGQTGDAPGLDDTTTTDADDGPGNSANAPGQTNQERVPDDDPNEPSGADLPDEVDRSPIPPDSPSGQSGDPPAPPEAPSGQVSTPPGQANNPPGQSDSAPSRADVFSDPSDETPPGPPDRPSRD